MTSNLPVISITAEQGVQSEKYLNDDTDNDECNLSCNYYSDASTDVEDMLSQDEEDEKIQAFDSKFDVVKDEYNSNCCLSPCSSEEKTVYSQLQVSLEELLCEKVGKPIGSNYNRNEQENKNANANANAKYSNFSSNCETEHEDYRTESEVEDISEKSACFNINEKSNSSTKICITDSSKLHKNDSLTCDNVPDESDAGASEYSCISDDNISFHDRSSTSNLELSVKVNALHLNSNVFDIHFTTAEQPSSPGTEQDNKHNLTNVDVDVDVDVDDNRQQDIPVAIVTTLHDESSCPTDLEDMTCDDQFSVDNSATQTIDFKALPLSHREIILLKENKMGDTITNILPIEDDYIEDNFSCDDCTQSEIYSSVDDLRPSNDISDNKLDLTNYIDYEKVTTNEISKPILLKRAKNSLQNISVTDDEQIILNGTNRRKKLKNRQLKKERQQSLSSHNINQDQEDTSEGSDSNEERVLPNDSQTLNVNNENDLSAKPYQFLEVNAFKQNKKEKQKNRKRRSDTMAFNSFSATQNNVTTIQDRNISVFNMDNEVFHIKGSQDMRDDQTEEENVEFDQPAADNINKF